MIDRIIDIIKKNRKIETDITPDTVLSKENGFKSLDVAEIIADIECEFDTEIPETIFIGEVTPQRIVEFLNH